jgi:hypothetical protein
MVTFTMPSRRTKTALPFRQSRLFVEKALTAGYRAMELDVGRCGLRDECERGTCIFHAQCLLGTRSIVTVLSTQQLLTENPPK